MRILKINFLYSFIGNSSTTIYQTSISIDPMKFDSSSQCYSVESVSLEKILHNANRCVRFVAQIRFSFERKQHENGTMTFEIDICETNRTINKYLINFNENRHSIRSFVRSFELKSFFSYLSFFILFCSRNWRVSDYYYCFCDFFYVDVRVRERDVPQHKRFVLFFLVLFDNFKVITYKLDVISVVND